MGRRSLSQQLPVERRAGQDRRRQPTLSLRSIFRDGQRSHIRRAEDRQRSFYVDRYRQSLFAAIVVILFLSVLDALFTLLLLQHGAVEINPVMAFYIDVGPYAFLAVKYGLTSLGVVFLLLFRNVVLKSLPIRAGALIYAVLAAFLGVVSWQIYLIGKLVI
jgi:hypothetical protein